jgi:two-component system LytT family response regulator
VAIKDNGRITFVNIADILSIEAQGNYVLLRRRSGSTMLRVAISTVERKLETHGFIRIHRSVLINVVHVESVEALTSGDYRVVLFGDKRYTVTRSYKGNLPCLAAIWFGSSGFYRQRS